MEDAIDGLLGQIQALSLTLTSLLGVLPQEQAARCAQQLRVALDVAKEEDLMQEEPSAARTIRSRNQIAEAYMELLEAQGSTG